MRIEWGGHELELLAERAVFRPRTRTLYIADPHFGKAASFRQWGVPVPAGTTLADLARLDGAIVRTQARRLVVLGDFLHARISERQRTLSLMETWWSQRRGLETTVVRGNHDGRAGDPPASLGICMEDEPFDDAGLLCCHHPRTEACRFVLAGHHHPAVVLEGADRSTLRAPCFRFGACTAILPAFGRFTGAKTFRPRPGERIFAVGPEVVAEVRTV